MMKLIATIFLLISCILLLAVPISEIVIGVKYFDACPLEPNIPLWLIVFGASCLYLDINAIALLAYRVAQFKIKFRPEYDINEILESKVYRRPNNLVELSFKCFVYLNGCLVVLSCLFTICWFLIGNFWVLPHYQRSGLLYWHESNSTVMCDNTGPVKTSQESLECSPFLYQYSFWLIIASFIFLMVLTIVRLVHKEYCSNDYSQVHEANPDIISITA